MLDGPTTQRAWRVPGVWFGLAMALLAITQPVSAGSPVEQIDVDVADEARGQGAVDEVDGSKNPRVESALVLDADTVSPGDRIRAGVLFTMDSDWHIYWRNSGDAGMSTAVDVTATHRRADGSTSELDVGQLQWPAPRVFERPNGNIVTFGYGGQVLLYTIIAIPDDASPGDSVAIKAVPDYLACKVECIPGGSELETSIDIAAETSRPDSSSPVARAYRRSSGLVPLRPDELGIQTEVVYKETPVRSGAKVEAAIGLDMCPDGPDACQSWSVIRLHDGFTFIPDATSQVKWTTVGTTDHPTAKRGQVIRLEGEASPNSPDEDERFTGVIHLENDRGAHRALLIDHPLPRGESDADVTTHDDPLLTVELPDDGSPAAGGSTGETAATTTSTTGADGASASLQAAGTGSSSPASPISLWQALLFAFIGGAILNLMPCVFPVLALKVSSFAKLVHEDRSHILAHGAAYTAGIVGSMLALAAIVLGLRAAGTQVGWGFQFQNPIFPAVLTGVLVLFAMNLFGVFEVNVSANEFAKSTKQASGLPRSAGEGVLAVVLATPCSAPFLGTAVGFALTAGPATIIGIFAMLGVGLAAPFVLLTLMPGWAKILPDPGEWMLVFKQILGFALLGTGIWLVWIVGRTQGVQGMTYALIFAGTVALAAWLFGWMQSVRKQSFPWLGALGSIAIIVGSGLWTLDFPDDPVGAGRTQTVASSSAQETSTNQETASGIDWRRWSRDNVDEELDNGRPVFVDFTADWCITCKVNERTVLSTKKVRRTLDNCGVTSFKADWTDGSERIRSKLAEHGKAGVPMYLVYSPSSPDDPQVLPEVLTTDMVVSALEKAAGGGRC